VVAVAYAGISRGGGQKRKIFENSIRRLGGEALSRRKPEVWGHNPQSPETMGFWGRSPQLLKKICNFEVKI